VLGEILIIKKSVVVAERLKIEFYLTIILKEMGDLTTARNVNDHGK